MKLGDLCEVFGDSQFPKTGEREHPELRSVLEVRAAVTSAVIDDDFLADCIALELDLLESDTPRRGLVPFFTVPGLGIQFAFGYWHPGGTPGPHEHTAWTITAVCRNRLEVVTYDREASYRRHDLVLKHHFDAPAGRVGYIYEPCIHQPTNTSDDWSLSLHVTSPRDGEPAEDDYGILPDASVRSRVSASDNHPYRHVIRARQRHNYIRELVRVLKAIDRPGVAQLLERCRAHASPATRRMIDDLQRSSHQRSQGRRPWLLTRVHEDLGLSYRNDGDTVALFVETVNGPQEELAISALARDAIAFATKTASFEVDSLPGNLMPGERSAVAEALEDTGLFKMVEP